MPYYKIYKRMKQRSAYQPSAFVSLHYALFAIIIPMIAGSVLGIMLKRIGIASDPSAFYIMVSSVAVGVIYIHAAEWLDKDP